MDDSISKFLDITFFTTGRSNSAELDKFFKDLSESEVFTNISLIISFLNDYKDHWLRLGLVRSLENILEFKTLSLNNYFIITEGLINLLYDNDDGIRCEAFEGILRSDLMERDPVKFNEVIDKLSKEKSWRVRRNVALYSLGRLTLEQLLLLLHDKDWLVRKKVIGCLEKFDDDKAREAIFAALNDKGWEVRSEALEILNHHINDNRIMDATKNALRDKHWRVGLKAIKILGNINDERVRETIRMVINDNSMYSKIRFEAQKILRRSCGGKRPRLEKSKINVN